MNRSRKTENKLCQIDRREFCRKVPWAAIGALSLSYISISSLKGMSFNNDTAISSLREKQSMEEKIMTKKITAVEAKVKSIKGACGLGHKVGDVARFTETGVEGKICIHALYSMIPAVFAMMFESQFPWLEDPDKKTHACPDAFNPVMFEITRIREK
ncbi:MAG: TIGR04076 family protein [Candidatus Aminicenantes bacterium]|nr:TIGR04076 family protein [Candidatus Aminicenantes bacterium]